MEYKIYEVVAKSDHFTVGDLVVLEDDRYYDMLVRKMTPVRIDNLLAFPGDEGNYWLGNRQWIPVSHIRYLRTE